MVKTNCDDVMQSIRKQCMDKGIGGIKGLCVMFRGMDTDYSKTLSFSELSGGLKRYKISISEEQLKTVYSRFDKDKNGTVDFREFLCELQPAMPKCRVKVINEAFDSLDANKDGLLKVEDLKIVYRSHAEKHPNFVSGKWTLEETLENFLKTFDSPDCRDGIVTREEFLNYYAVVGATVDDDAYFDLMMRSCWGLAPRGYKLVK